MSRLERASGRASPEEVTRSRPASPGPGRFALRVAIGAMADFWHRGCLTLAAALAFFSLLSFFPLVFLLLSLTSAVSQELLGHEHLLNLLHGFLPTLGGEVAAEITRLAGEQTVRWVAFGAFVWFGVLVFYEVDYAVNVVFETADRRHPLGSTVVAFALLGLVGLFFTLSFLATQILQMLLRHASMIGNIDFTAMLANHFLLSYLVPFVLVLIVGTGLYRYLPRARPTWAEAAIGGATLALLWEVAKHGFTLYVQHLTVYSLMYGSFLVMVLFLLWVYYSAALLLFGAAVVHRVRLLSHPSGDVPSRPAHEER